MQANHTMTNEADELLRAEQAVQESRAELTRSLRQASKTSKNVLRRVQAELKPGLVIAAAVVGAVVVTGAVVAISRRGRNRWISPQPSPMGVVARAVGLWALRFAARSAAQALVARLEQPQLSPPPPAPAAQ